MDKKQCAGLPVVGIMFIYHIGLVALIQMRTLLTSSDAWACQEQSGLVPQDRTV